MDHDIAQHVAPLHFLEFGRRDHAALHGDNRDITHIGLRIVGETAGLLGLANLRFDRFGFEGGGEGQFDGAHRLAFG